ncbi:MAG: hypothetical protein LJF04_08615 [Gemmatimonadetes bacterium]|nr:hypothetical protein [Gemmatimonadota bacterium]
MKVLVPALCLLLLPVPGALPMTASAQVLAHPVLHGKVFVGDSAASEGRVVLHHISSGTQGGAVDSTDVHRDGTFTFRLPTVPDSTRNEIYFVLTQHDGVLYFGTPITLPVQLDSLYVIHTYDTTMVAPEGVSLPLQVRDVFLERDSTGSGWRVTDLMQVHNDRSRTLTARENGAVWRYPLPAKGTGFSMGQTGFALDAASFDKDTLVVSAPIPPGNRLFVVRYTVPDPFITIPLPGATSSMELLIREPAPPLTVTGLEAQQSVQLQQGGATYRHFIGQDLHDASVTLEAAAAPKLPPVRWFAVILALVLAGFGLKAYYASRPRAEGAGAGPGATTLPPAGDGVTRQALLVQIARLDEEFEAKPAPTDEERAAYRARREDLLSRLRGQG